MLNTHEYIITFKLYVCLIVLHHKHKYIHTHTLTINIVLNIYLEFIIITIHNYPPSSYQFKQR